MIRWPCSDPLRALTRPMPLRLRVAGVPAPAGITAASSRLGLCDALGCIPAYSYYERHYDLFPKALGFIEISFHGHPVPGTRTAS